ncbi:O-antigen/teichoic acid export membrane protein [Methanocalculus alkaliphilus]|uniref:oligosaccharide flippase family protein n=1 Tax=Methanocalculus alkaliphilus TaxID=768730 RepID=UPI00209CB99E|nr:oligosaccharide flippase family protein [Methanocalculus alkaliphilus]MCP1716095.1 O-antigen/teichoic acid export membrane protein [Methanocalculus alkaliphilus]
MNWWPFGKQKAVTFLTSTSIGAKFIHFINKNPLYKGVLVLGSGTALAQLIGILSMPIITRLYTPSDLGMLTIYSSILSLVIVTASFRYEIAYPLPKKNEDVVNLFALCLLLLIGTTIGFSLLLIIAGNFFIVFFNLDSVQSIVWLLIIGFFGMGLYTILNHWAIRQRNYTKITHTKINQSVSGSVAKIVLGMLAMGPIGLIVGHIISQIAGIGTFLKAIWKSERTSFKVVSFSGIRSVAKEYWKFPAFSIPSSFLNAFALQLPPIMLLYLYNSQIVGFYALAHMLIVAPGSVIKASIGQAFHGDAAKMVREGSPELKTLYIQTVKHLSLLAIPLIGIPSLLGPLYVPILFGEEWIDAGWYLLPLALMVIPAFVISPITRLDLLGYNHWMLIWDAMRVLGVVGGFYICYLFEFPVLLTLTVYSIILLIMYFIVMLLNLKAIDNFNLQQWADKPV